MRVKKVNRYYCEFCKKAGCSGGHMKHHEERCTMNPNRICGVCKMLEQEQPKLADIIKLLPDPQKFKKIDQWETETWDGLSEAINGVMPNIREASGNCPVCILAAFRQAKINLSFVDDFDFKKEMAAVWSDINSINREQATYIL